MLRRIATVLPFLALGCGASSRDTLPVPSAWSPRVIEFAGRYWTARDSLVPVGAGPNLWSAAPSSVELSQDSLRLKTRREGDHWYGAEVATELPGGYFFLSARLAGALGALDKNVIASLFIYENDYSEMDFEFGRFGEEVGPNAQFVVAPATSNNRVHRFALDEGTREAQLSLLWKESLVEFCLAAPATRCWSFTGRPRPVPGRHRLHFNLWFHSGQAPTTGQPTEISLRDLQIRPLHNSQL